MVDAQCLCLSMAMLKILCVNVKISSGMNNSLQTPLQIGKSSISYNCKASLQHNCNPVLYLFLSECLILCYAKIDLVLLMVNVNDKFKHDDAMALENTIISYKWTLLGMSLMQDCLADICLKMCFYSFSVCMNKYVFLPSDVCIFLNVFFTIITLCHHNIGIQSILKRHSRCWSILTHRVCCLPRRLTICFFLVKTFIDLPTWDVSPLPPIVFVCLTNQISCSVLIIKPLTWTPLSPP